MAYKIVRESDINLTNQYIRDLEDKASAASRVSKQIDSFISNSTKRLKGTVYDAVRTNLSVYQKAYDKLSQLCIFLADHIEAANTDFLEYVSACIDDDPVNARDHIPKYEDEIKQKQALIKQKEAQIEELKKVRPTPITTKDEKGNEIYGLYDYTEYNKAQEEIGKLTAEIAELQARIDKLKKIIEYLKRLDSEDNKACQKLEDIMIEIQKFNSDIEAMEVSNIS